MTVYMIEWTEDDGGESSFNRAIIVASSEEAAKTAFGESKYSSRGATIRTLDGEEASQFVYSRLNDLI